MPRPAPSLALSSSRKAALEGLVRSGNTPQNVARRCRLLLLAHEGVANQAIVPLGYLEVGYLEGGRISGTAAFLGKHHGFAAGLSYRPKSRLKALPYIPLPRPRRREDRPLELD